MLEAKLKQLQAGGAGALQRGQGWASGLALRPCQPAALRSHAIVCSFELPLLSADTSTLPLPCTGRCGVGAAGARGSGGGGRHGHAAAGGSSGSGSGSGGRGRGHDGPHAALHAADPGHLAHGHAHGHAVGWVAGLGGVLWLLLVVCSGGACMPVCTGGAALAPWLPPLVAQPGALPSRATRPAPQAGWRAPPPSRCRRWTGGSASCTPSSSSCCGSSAARTRRSCWRPSAATWASTPAAPWPPSSSSAAACSGRRSRRTARRCSTASSPPWARRGGVRGGGGCEGRGGGRGQACVHCHQALQLAVAPLQLAFGCGEPRQCPLLLPGAAPTPTPVPSTDPCPLYRPPPCSQGELHQEDNATLAYWLSNTVTLLYLMQKNVKPASGGGYAARIKASGQQVRPWAGGGPWLVSAL